VSRGTFDRGGTRGVRGCTPSPLTQVFLSERTIKRGEGEKRLKKNNVKFTQGKKYNLMLKYLTLSADCAVEKKEPKQLLKNDRVLVDVKSYFTLFPLLF